MTVCIYFHSMNGTVQTLLDVYLLLKSKYTVNCLVIVESFSTLLPFLTYFPKDITFTYKNNVHCLTDSVLICSAYLFKSLSLRRINFDVDCKQVIIFDSTSLVMDHFDKHGTVLKIKSLPNYVVLGNRFNSSFFDSNYVVFKPPIYFDRLNSYSALYSSIYVRADDQRMRNKNPLSFKSLFFYRNVKIANNFYYENIGRLLFEYLYFDRKVYYSAKNKTVDDGLTEHLNGVGIDDNKNMIIRDKKHSVVNYFQFDLRLFSSLL